MKQRGFSMIQLIISMVILSVLGATAGYGLTGGARAFSESSDVLQTLSQLRYASERMAREIRQIRRDTVDSANLDITTMTATSLQFTRGNGVEVTLISSPPMLAMAYATPVGTWTLADEVSSMTFLYYQSDGVTTATSNSTVAFIELNLELARGGTVYPQRTRVALRNRR